MAGLNPDFLDTLTGPLAAVYNAIEDELLQNIAKHFNTGKALATSQWELKKLAEIGKLNKENAAIIAKYAGQVPELTQIALEAAAWEALKDIEPAFAEAVRRSYLDPVRYAPDASPAIQNALRRFSDQALSDLNLVNTTMLRSSLDAYRKAISNTVRLENAAKAQQIMNTAAGKVVLGTSSRTEALRTAIKQMADEGISGFYDRSGRKWSPEAYVNMDIRTTVTNTARAATFARCDDYDLDLIEISSHAGSRPKCAVDQGKIVSRSNKSGSTKDAAGNTIRYVPFSSTSYGQPDGIFGINCGHHPDPFIPGYSFKRAEETKDFKENDAQYKLSQQQRRIEENTRAAKREAMTAKAAGDQEAFEKAAAKVKAQQSKYQDFCAQTGRTPRNDRMQVVGYDRKTAQDVANANAEYLKRQKASVEKQKQGLTFAVEGDKISIGRIQEAFGNERAAEVQSLLAHAPTEVKAVWNKYADNIRFESTRHHGTAYYSSTDNQIRLNLEEDARKSVFHVPYQTTMHEIGHFFDFTAASEIYGTGSIPISRRYFSGAFSKTIREEAEAYTKKVHERLRAEAVAKGLKASSVSIKEVRAIISQELWNIGKVYGPVASGDLSDIFEGATKGKITGTAGHGSTYWTRVDVGVEAFAEMLSATICNPLSLTQIKNYFPRSYEVFLEILKTML